MRWFGLLLVLALVAGSWFLFANTGERMEKLESRIESLLESGDVEAEIPGLRNQIQSLDSTRTFNGILLAITSAVFLGILFVTFILPNWASRVSQSVYGSNAEVDEPAAYQEARALLAKGKYDEAIAAYRKAAGEDPANRLPWTEMARIQARNQGQPKEAIATLREAMESWEWPDDDRAFFFFRQAELHNEEAGGRGEAVVALRRVIHDFPDSRHAMNARNRLKEWGVG